jgi:hypothetical protein
MVALTLVMALGTATPGVGSFALRRGGRVRRGCGAAIVIEPGWMPVLVGTA